MYCGAGGSLGAGKMSCDVCGIQLGRGCVVCGLVCSMSSGLFFSVGIFRLQVSIVCVCVCVCAWLGAFGLSTGEKKNLTNVKECREGKLIWRVPLF